MNRRELLLGFAAAALAGCAGRAPRWTERAGARYGSPAALPMPAPGAGMPLETAIRLRRSRRAFRSDPLPLESIGQLLWAGQGITGSAGRRTAPSAGGLYPLELYAVTRSQVMHYVPDGHRVQIRAVPDLRPQLRAAAFGQDTVAAAPAVLVITARPSRTQHRYGTFANAFVDREVGHVAQNMLLTAAASGLAAVPIGSLDTARCARVLELAPEQDVRYLLPVGLPR